MYPPYGHSEQCDCKARHAAEKNGFFVRNAELHGWVFVDSSLRHRSTAAAMRGIESHEGEPYVWHCCFWCGRDLPEPPEVTWTTDATGDPNE